MCVTCARDRERPLEWSEKEGASGARRRSEFEREETNTENACGEKRERDMRGIQ